MAAGKLVVNIVSSYTGGGAEFLVRELNSNLSSDEFEHETIFFNSGFGGFPSHPEDNVHILNVPSRSPMAIIKLRQYLVSKTMSFDKVIVHAHLTWPFYYVAMAASGLKVKLLYTEHHTSNRRRRVPLLKYFDRYVYSRYHAIICISEGVKRSLIGWIGDEYSTKLHTVPNGAKLLRYIKRESLNGKKVNLVSVGRLVSDKGFDVTIKSLTNISALVNCYTIVGDGPEMNYLNGLVEKYNLNDIVQLVGWSDKVEEYLAQADIQLIPSVREGFGIVAIEGMSTGLPVIASDIPGLEESVDSEISGSFMVKEFRNHAEWAAHIKLMVEKLNFSGESFASASRAHAENFSISRMVDKYRDIYLMVFKDKFN